MRRNIFWIAVIILALGFLVQRKQRPGVDLRPDEVSVMGLKLGDTYETAVKQFGKPQRRLEERSVIILEFSRDVWVKLDPETRTLTEIAGPTAAFGTRTFSKGERFSALHEFLKSSNINHTLVEMDSVTFVVLHVPIEGAQMFVTPTLDESLDIFILQLDNELKV